MVLVSRLMPFVCIEDPGPVRGMNERPTAALIGVIYHERHLTTRTFRFFKPQTIVGYIEPFLKVSCVPPGKVVMVNRVSVVSCAAAGGCGVQAGISTGAMMHSSPAAIGVADSLRLSTRIVPTTPIASALQYFA
jgi:hypothetical protein